MKKEDIKILTLPEYYKFLEEFFSGRIYQGKVVKLICRGMLSLDWTYLIPPGVHDTDYYAKIWWETDDFLQREIPTYEEMLKKLNKSYFTSDRGMMIRCLFNEKDVIYQPFPIPTSSKGLKERIKDIKRLSDTDIFMGFRTDPYTFVAKYKLLDEKYIDDGHTNPEIRDYNANEDNYRVFYITMDVDKFLEEEKRYLEHGKTGTYHDDFITPELEHSEVWQEFLDENTDTE